MHFQDTWSMMETLTGCCPKAGVSLHSSLYLVPVSAEEARVCVQGCHVTQNHTVHIAGKKQPAEVTTHENTENNKGEVLPTMKWVSDAKCRYPKDRWLPGHENGNQGPH